MQTRPIAPARIAPGPDGAPLAPDFGDRYHPRIGALAQARHVFLGGNGLPGRWAGREHFTILETGFGLGHNFIATWDAWRRDPLRPRWLHYVALELHPPSVADLARWQDPEAPAELAMALRQAWPPATPNLHPLHFEGGRVRLLLGFGDIAALLPQLRLAADAFYLDGFAPARNPAMWTPEVLKRLGRRAAPGATAATWSVARELCDGLVTAGFEIARAPGIGGKREITVARHAPRWTPRGTPPPALHRGPREAVVVGAGLAGAATARALAGLGWAVRVLDRHAAPAAEASGNPAGLFHGIVHADDGPHARLLRAAALQATRVLGPAIASGVPGAADGLLRLAGRDEGPAALAAMQALLARQALPNAYVQALSAEAASAAAGLALDRPAWFYPGGGWVDPGAWVRALLAGLSFQGGAEVAAVQPLPDAGGWRVLDAQGRPLAEAPVLVLAHPATLQRVLATLPGGAAGLPLLGRTQGQIERWQGGSPWPLRLPLAGDGYALPLRDGLLCGATSKPLQGELPAHASGDDVDSAFNRERLQRLCGLLPPAAAGAAVHGRRVAARLQTVDRLPLLGPWRGNAADAGAPPPGLYIASALGSRGITWAALLGELLAAQIQGTPLPLEQDLVAALDPARGARSARRGPGPRRAPQPG